MMKTLHYFRSGNGMEKILFIHGNLASSHWWRPAMIRLDDSFDMLAVDLRGCGRSERGKADITIKQHAEDIMEILQQQHFFPCTVAGHSLGGAVAMQLAVDMPSYLKAMILVDSAYIGGMGPFDYSLLETVVKDEQVLLTSLKATLAVDVPPALMEGLIADCLLAKDVFIPNSRALTTVDFSEKAPSFMKPVLVMQGEKDAVVPLSEAQKTARLYPHASLVILPASGHNPQIEVPDLFAETVRQFIASL